jgi:AraC-like DNA-binding protein
MGGSRPRSRALGKIWRYPGAEKYAPRLHHLEEVIPVGNLVTTIHRPERSRLEISKTADIPDALDRAYGASLRLKLSLPCNRATPLRLARTAVGAFAIDELDVPIDVEACPDPLGKVLVVWVSRGTLSGRSGGLTGAATTGDITLISQPDLEHQSTAEDLTATSVLIDPSIVTGVAAGVSVGEALLPLRFSSFDPVDPQAVRRWKETVRYLQTCVLADDAIATPLVLGHAGRLLAAVTLAAFPHATREPSACDHTDSRPILLRKAMDYIDANLANDIGLADIAEAVHVTPRAVQYMFRRHLDRTPLQWLRQMRLRRAHMDLLAADRAHATVTDIAARWGFAHTGRFAVLYRQAYGESPYQTLRG